MCGCRTVVWLRGESRARAVAGQIAASAGHVPAAAGQVAAGGSRSRGAGHVPAGGGDVDNSVELLGLVGGGLRWVDLERGVDRRLDGMRETNPMMSLRTGAQIIDFDL